MRFTLSATGVPGRDEVLALYASVGWTAYTDEPDDLMEAITNSSYVVTARGHDGLIGLARVVGDDRAIAYLQDVLVHPAHQGSGVGRALVDACLERFSHVRTILLMTDDEPRQLAFYESLGFTNTRVTGLNTFVRLR